MKRHSAALLAGRTLACGYSSKSTTPAMAGTMPTIAELAPPQRDEFQWSGVRTDRQGQRLFLPRNRQLERHGANHNFCECQPIDRNHRGCRYRHSRRRPHHGYRAGHRRHGRIWQRTHAGGDFGGGEY
jgi:hypothetical protein